jgi:hypothetical protein
MVGQLFGVGTAPDTRPGPSPNNAPDAPSVTERGAGAVADQEVTES